MHCLYSIPYEVTASTCFEHCLLIFRRRCTTNRYIACVFCLLASTRVDHLRLGLPIGLFLSGFPHQNPVHTSPLLNPSYMPRPFPSSRFHHRHKSGWGVQIMKLLITYFSLLSCYLVALRLKYSPRRHILKHPQPTFLPQCQRPGFTPIHNRDWWWTVHRFETCREKLLK
jgi:hypothetical protein